MSHAILPEADYYVNCVASTCAALFTVINGETDVVQLSVDLKSQLLMLIRNRQLLLQVALIQKDQSHRETAL